MNKRFRFTQARIKDLTEPDHGRVDYYDEEVPKLTCRVSSTGHKSFAVVKYVNGRVTRVTLGTFPDISVPDARQLAQDALSTIHKGINPTALKKDQKAKEMTLRDVFKKYLSSHKLKPTTLHDYDYKLKTYFSEWLDKPASRITEKKVLQKHTDLTEIGNTTANTAMRVLRATLNYAQALGAIDEVPTTVLNKARRWHKNQRKKRLIPTDKLKKWHSAVEKLDNQKAKNYIFLIIYMGFRSSEALGIRWENVDLKTGKLTVKDTKNGTDHTLPIPDSLKPRLRRLKKETGNTYWLFPASGEGNKPMWTPKKNIQKVIDDSGVIFSPHDCRRTFATIAEAVLIPETMIKRLMNHTTSNEVTGGYIITEQETLREALNKISNYIQAKVEQKDNVLPFASKAVPN